MIDSTLKLNLIYSGGAAMFKKFLSFIIICFVYSSTAIQNASAQTEKENAGISGKSDIEKNSGNSFFSAGGLSADINPFWTPGETDFKAGMRYSVLVGVPVVHLVYGFAMWDWGEQKQWHSAHERWFQGDTDSGGADKAGHFFAHYTVSRISYSLFSYTEQSRGRALFYSAFTAALVGTMIELGDAYTGRYGFSYEDLTADYTGIAVAFLLDRYPVLDEFIGITESYVPSKAFKSENDKTYFNFAGDYSGAKWMVNFKLAGFKYIGFDIPEFMRYIQLDAGYYTRDYTDYDEDYNQDVDPQRHLFIGVSVNMREVSRDLFRKSDRKAGWIAEQPFKYYHVPLGYEKKNTI